MGVLQLIDSLAPGGAERMAVTLANEWALKGNSYLCTTRAEGVLKESLSKEVQYLFLQRTSTLDIHALFRLKKWVLLHKIEIIHAHTTSYFIATLLKILCPKLKLVWHEHHGKRVFQTAKKNRVLVFCSKYFNAIITVNEALEHWCKQNLKSKQVSYIPNFIAVDHFTLSDLSSKNIVCLANLRTPKNHLNLLEAFKKVNKQYPTWKLQLVGQHFEDSYANTLHRFVAANNLENEVLFAGSQSAIKDYLSQASIGVLSSDSEGLPMALLEYGASGLAVVCTSVGQCEQVIGGFGTLVAPKDSESLAKGIMAYIENPEKRMKHGHAFRKRIALHFSLENCLDKLITLYRQ